MVALDAILKTFAPPQTMIPKRVSIAA